MITSTFSIRFNFPVDAARLNITLQADVQEHHSDTYYLVSNFHVPGHDNRPMLPPIKIRKEGDLWVHTDSGKATNLSVAAGEAIDAMILKAP
ncbi:MAG TPA: hypothetical protein VHE54_04295 [Puia sp.]|nr:hypothetical protein [Puia sp.]